MHPTHPLAARVVTVVGVAGLMLLAAVNADAAARFRETTMPNPDGGELPYAISVPDGEREGVALPLVLALHPGGERVRYYGSVFARMVVAPALADLNAIIVAPDCPTKSWAEPGADRAVMALLDKVMKEHTIDRKRVLVVGFSMGGRGTWYMAGHHADLFTAAIPMAASLGDEKVEGLGLMPTYIIHSRMDQVVPFAPAEQNAQALEQLGRAVKFEALTDLGHFDMRGYVPALRRAVTWIGERW
jgi:predicted peptidase